MTDRRDRVVEDADQGRGIVQQDRAVGPAVDDEAAGDVARVAYAQGPRIGVEDDRAHDARVSWKRTGSPAWRATTSPSRMTTLPRMTVATGQPWASKPSKGVQPERVAMASWAMVRRAFRSTMVRSAS